MRTLMVAIGEQLPTLPHSVQLFTILEEAKMHEQAWWEEQAAAYMVENKESDRLNPSLWSRSMAARFPKKYRESTKTEITGAEGAPLLQGIQVTFVKPQETE